MNDVNEMIGCSHEYLEKELGFDFIPRNLKDEFLKGVVESFTKVVCEYPPIIHSIKLDDIAVAYKCRNWIEGKKQTYKEAQCYECFARVRVITNTINYENVKRLQEKYPQAVIHGIHLEDKKLRIDIRIWRSFLEPKTWENY